MALPRWLSRATGRPGTVSLKRFARTVKRADHLGAEIGELDDAALAERIRTTVTGTGKGFAADDAAAEFLAIAREAMDRAIELRPYEEQLLAVCALLSGIAVELDTGEGKTLVAAMAAAGHVVAGRTVHVLSVNDYLAQRDSEWMGPFFELLDIGHGWIGQETPHDKRRETYRCAVVHAPVSEIGFDVLRDRFATSDDDRVLPVFDAVVVDEADAVMIDEAMTPLVLAGTSDDSGQEFVEATSLVADLVEHDHFDVDPERLNVALTDAGLDLVEHELGVDNLYAEANLPTLTKINLALHARVLVHRDVDYLVVDDTVKLINTARGRVAEKQRWPDGLHAAIEAKEGVASSAPGRMLDSITIQDLLVSYDTLAGMSGTILPVAEELLEFYEITSGRVERHRPNRRVDEPPQVFLTTEAKIDAVIEEVMARHEDGQPVLIGTQSVAESEDLGEALEAEGLPVQVLNARNDAGEAAVIAAAGEYGAITISTQMSGRGTDIKLGGADAKPGDAAHKEVVGLGGLAVMSTGRYPSSRLDAQLRGRAGRQGDPGTSMAFDALDSELVRANAAEHQLVRIEQDGQHLTPGQALAILDSVQAISEGLRGDRHRATWAYHRAITQQRTAVLERRERIIDSDEALEPVLERVADWRAEHEEDAEEAVRTIVRQATLHFLDEAWTDHLAGLQELRDGIHLRALAGQNPEQEFHLEALRRFEGFFGGAQDAAVEFLAALGADEIAAGLEDLATRRPSSTWTYMISDNPLGSAADRGTRKLGRLWRSKVLRAE
ncbi:accessory Sec system translocase SecA2 [Propionibacteriaceae bacterium Y2011]